MRKIVRRFAFWYNSRCYVVAQGSLRAAIDGGLFEDRLTGRPQYLTVLNLALGVARAMHHLHSEGVLHGDLKVWATAR